MRRLVAYTTQQNHDKISTRDFFFVVLNGNNPFQFMATDNKLSHTSTDCLHPVHSSQVPLKSVYSFSDGLTQFFQHGFLFLIMLMLCFLKRCKESMSYLNSLFHPCSPDIDECQEGKDNCDKTTTTCRNFAGSFECDCKRGHVSKDKSSCQRM